MRMSLRFPCAVSARLNAARTALQRERAAATQSRRLQKRVYVVARLSILHAGYATPFGNTARKNHVVV